MILDHLLLAIVLVLLIASILLKRSVFAVIVCTVWMLVNTALLYSIDDSSWSALFSSLKQWAIIHAIKDGLLVLLFALRSRKIEYPLILLFGLSSAFHQLCAIDISGYNLSLIEDYRVAFMTYISSGIIAALFIIAFFGGQRHGGKRTRATMRGVDSDRVYFSNLSAYEIKR